MFLCVLVNRISGGRAGGGLQRAGGYKGVFIEKGPFFSPEKGLLKIPVGGLLKEGGGGAGGGGGWVRVEFGKRARPLYREKKAPFR